MDTVYKDLGLMSTLKSKNDTSILKALYKPVKKDKGLNMPKFTYPKKGLIIQADLLFMPDDNGYKYILVTVDNGSRMVDAEPLKTKDNKAVLAAFNTIFSRKIINEPKVLEVDNGSEFKGNVLKYFQDKGIKVRVAQTGRHRQQALVEKANQTIGTILHKRMAAQEILTDQVSREWTNDLPKLIKSLNKYINKRETKRKKTQVNHDEPVCEGDSCNLLNIGDKVRVALDYPIDASKGKRLYGKIRQADIKWNPKPRTIKEVLMQPNQPPLYLLDGPVSKLKITPVAYTKNQLSLINEKETLPDTKLIQTKPDEYKVEKIVGKKKLNNRIYYKVRWFGFREKDDTFEPRVNLLQDVPDMVKDYESTLKKVN